MNASSQHERLAVAYLALVADDDRKVNVRALRDEAKVSTAAAAEFLRSTDSTADYALSGLDTKKLLASLVESLAEQARVEARAAARREIDAARASETRALEENETLTLQLREAQLQAAADAATIAALRETRTETSR